jgi:hypothetical protein
MCKTPQLCAVCTAGCTAALPIGLVMCAYKYHNCLQGCKGNCSTASF